ncbi:MAG: type I glyceraldehyde-3-phosphate dehydrogenase [Planctomycetales bacterium 4484_113]|nr:MAG: type I glyceraldehyde-3-phosphate dehydrogenase [Planctomycetales bacterium 4484_113]
MNRIKVGINGFGRIGRLVARALFQSGLVNEVNLVAVNDIADNPILAHLFAFDSTYGSFPGEVKLEGDDFVVNGHRVITLEERDPSKLPWGELGVDIVLESSGKFRTLEGASMHLKGGAKKVIISAPAKSEGVPTFVMGVNQESYDPAKHHVVSNASCTTNCLAPVACVLQREFGIRRALVTTVHSITNDQSILDQPHRDYRRARSAEVSMIPTTTGAAVATALVLPELSGKLDGMAVRVPTMTVSLVDLVAELEKPTTVKEINQVFCDAAQGKMARIVAYNDVPLVSVDFRGNPHSAIFDAGFTHVLDGNLIKVLAWYDNEWGYAHRCVDLMVHMALKGI